MTATLRAPANVASGNTVVVDVSGPKNESDTIAIVPAGSPEGTGAPGHNDYVFDRAQVSVRAPERPGDYEIRYVRGQSQSTLAFLKLSVGGTSPTVKGPSKAEAGSEIKVQWTRPGNEYDQIVIAAQGAPENDWKSSNFVFDRSPTTLRVPVELGTMSCATRPGRAAPRWRATSWKSSPLGRNPGFCA